MATVETASTCTVSICVRLTFPRNDLHKVLPLQISSSPVHVAISSTIVAWPSKGSRYHRNHCNIFLINGELTVTKQRTFRSIRLQNFTMFAETDCRISAWTGKRLGRLHA